MKQVALSVGDPASVGVITSLNLINSKIENKNAYALHLFADKNWLYENAKVYFSDKKILLDIFENKQSSNEYQVFFHHHPLNKKAQLTVADSSNASYVIECLNDAIDFARTNKNSALVTGAIDKSLIQSFNKKFKGHTEYFYQKFKKPVLMDFLIKDFHQNQKKQDLHIALLTDHMPLEIALKKIKDVTYLEDKLTLFNNELEIKFNIKNPKIGVLGLNPHAGENGVLGREEIELINPLISRLNKEKKFNFVGAISADTALLFAKRNGLDALFSVYHDQLLPAIKYSFFDKSINITLGLDFIRTSVDHGTAFDIANQPDLINSKPLYLAVNQALKMIDLQQVS